MYKFSLYYIIPIIIKLLYSGIIDNNYIYIHIYIIYSAAKNLVCLL